MALSDSMLRIVVRMGIDNTGQAPGVFVRHVAELIVGRTQRESNAESEQRLKSAIAADCKRASEPLNPFAIFPGLQYQSIPVNLDYDPASYKNTGAQFFSLAVVACVDYQIPITHSHRQTTFLGYVNGDPHPVPVVGVDSTGKFTLADTPNAHEILRMIMDAN